MDDLEQARLLLEEACQRFKDPDKQQEAEKILLQFRNSPSTFRSCQHILQYSASLEARFHAACTLREGMLREWAVLSHEELRQRQGYLLTYFLDAAESRDSSLRVVWSTMVETLAVMLKRGWQSGNRDLLQDLERAVQARHTLSAQRAFLQLLEAVVQEFSLITASAIGLSWEYHEGCHQDLEINYLPKFFSHALGVAVPVVQDGRAASGEDEGLCAAALSLMTAILTWDFKGGTHNYGVLLGGNVGKRRTRAKPKPGDGLNSSHRMDSGGAGEASWGISYK